MARSKKADRSKGITFNLSDSQRKAIEALAGGRKVRLSGKVEGRKMVVDFVACNAPIGTAYDMPVKKDKD